MLDIKHYFTRTDTHLMFECISNNLHENINRVNKISTFRTPMSTENINKTMHNFSRVKKCTTFFAVF